MSDDPNSDPISKKAWLVFWLLLLAGLYVLFDDSPKQNNKRPQTQDTGRLI